MTAPVIAVIEHRHIITFAPSESGQLSRLERTLENLMEAIDQLRADLAASNQSNTALSGVLESAAASVTGLVGDIANLNGQIATLSDLLANAQNLPADVLAASKAVVEGNAAMLLRAQAIANALAAADAQTPPVVPAPAPAA